MKKSLERDNLVAALKGEDIIRVCKQCKFYEKSFMIDALCNRDITPGYNLVTGKKSTAGGLYACKKERARDDDFGIPSCGAKGKYWAQKETFSFRRMFKKDKEDA